MADPVVVAIPADTWTKVSGAAGITSGQFDILKSGPNAYYRTYNAFGTGLPANNSTALIFFDNFQFENATLSDVYVKAVGAAGSILASI
jgi:hypothetical protein